MRLPLLSVSGIVYGLLAHGYVPFSLDFTQYGIITMTFPMHSEYEHSLVMV
jgi:hypothetical protein